MTTDPHVDYVDADGVLHRWDGAGEYSGVGDGDWYHPDPRRPLCRDRSCPGNPLVSPGSPLRYARPLLERLEAHRLLPSPTDDEVTVVVLRVDSTVDRDVLAVELNALLLELDHRLRLVRVTASADSTATVRPDQPTESTEPGTP